MPIKLNELREGNYYDFGHDLYGKVKLDKKNFKYFVAFASGNTASLSAFTLQQINPIPMSFEILEKGGLKKNMFNQFEFDIRYMRSVAYKSLIVDIRDGFIFLREGRTEFRNEDETIFLWNRDVEAAYYVHQLQNLYFSITQKELPLKLLK